MRSLFWFLTLFALATAVALAVSLNTGYVLIVVAPWRIEVSLAVFVIGLVLGCLGLYALSRLIITTLNLPTRVQAYRLRRSRNRARSALYQGLTSYFEGNFRKAERQAELALESGESPALSAVIAARAAHEQRRFEARDRYLDKAAVHGPEARLLHLTTRADLLLDERRYIEALDLLREAHRVAPKQVRAHQLLLKAQVATGAWKPALETVDLLEHLSGMDAAQAHRVRRNAWQQLLRQSAHQQDELLAVWRSIPGSLRSDNALAHSAAGYLIDLGLHKEAQALIERNLEKEWDAALVALYGECQGESALAQIEKAERWLRDHPDNAVLLLTLAKLCMRQSLWGKAQSYLDASLFIDHSREGQHLKAELMEKIGDARATPRLQSDLGPEYGAA
jgi:HemY protein